MTYLRNIPQTALMTMVLLSGCVTSASTYQSAPAVQGGYLQPVPAAPAYNGNAPIFDSPTPGNVNDVPPVPPPAPSSDSARLPVSVKSRSMAAAQAADKVTDLFN